MSVDVLAAHLGVVSQFEAASPRSAQVVPGPSELGGDCRRRLVGLAAGVKPTIQSDKWLAVIGTATHAWLADAYRAENEKAGYRRFLVEHAVSAGSVSGTLDLFELGTGTVWDHKVLGRASRERIARYGIGRYGTQLNLYGLGLETQGWAVTTVGLLVWPRDAPAGVAAMAVTQPYDSQAAVDALEEFDQARAFVAGGGGVLDAEPTPERGACMFCPVREICPEGGVL
jgi:hypothetical protein